MTAQLSPQNVFRSWDNLGLPLFGGKLNTYAAGTTNPQATYTDSTQATPNTNPVILNFRGEAFVWLDPTLTYKFVLTDAFNNTIWTEDNIPGGFGANPLSINLIPNPTNTFTLGNSSFSWANVYLGPNNAPVLDPISGNIGYYARTAAEIAAGVTPTNFAYAPGNIRRYGALVDGATDDSAAIRSALDVAGQNCTVVTCYPPGQIKVGSTVYIPQNPASGHTPMRLSFVGCVFIGQGLGTGTIFESGTGTFSTVSKGGATNFGQPNETATSLHYATIIEGALFTACSAAIRLFNFVYGCEVRDVRFENVSIPLYTLRCFASRYLNMDSQVITIGAGVYVFQFDGLTNAIVVQGCSAQGGGSNTTGIGFGFTGSGAGITFEGNTAEHLDKGLLVQAIQGMSIRQNYFEALTTYGIDATAASNKQMDVDQNWFNGVATVINAQLWIAGKFGAANDILGGGGLVNISDVNSFCTVEIAGQVFTESTATATAIKVPASYTLGPSVTLLAPREVYAAASGFSAPIVVDASYGRLNVPAFSYAGGPVSDGTSYFLPFTTQTNSLGSSTILSQITFSIYHLALMFDLIGDIGGGGSIHLYGLIFGNGNVFRCDANTAAWTVTASNSGGNVLLTVNGTGLAGKTMTGWNGQIRHM